MHNKRNSKSQFLALLCFMVAGVAILTNGFLGRVLAEKDKVDIYPKLEPIAQVLDTIMREYYTEPDVDDVVVGALKGMMVSLDKHSAFITPDALEALKEDTEGQFDGIGVSIRQDDDGRIVVFQPLPDSPAAKAGVRAFDVIVAIDDVSTLDMDLAEAADLIRGPRGTTVKITVERGHIDENAEIETIEFEIERGKIPLESAKETRLLEGDIGYIRISDFKKHTVDELAEHINELLDKGMTSLILDLRWNVGGLLTASIEVSDLFLPKNMLVTYTEGRPDKQGRPTENMKLYTEKQPIVPEGFPLIVLVNEQTASSAEIVIGALQYWSRAIILGQNTYGKGSVQTIIPLSRPRNSALRLTTALYYTPAHITIHNQGIKPDVEVEMDLKHQADLWQQMYDSYKDDPSLINEQNHGTVTGNETTEETVEDLQLQKAAEILRQTTVFDQLIEKYHKDTSITQVAAGESKPVKAGTGKEPAKDGAEPSE